MVFVEHASFFAGMYEETFNADDQLVVVYEGDLGLIAGASAKPVSPLEIGTHIVRQYVDTGDHPDICM